MGGARTKITNNDDPPMMMYICVLVWLLRLEEQKREGAQLPIFGEDYGKGNENLTPLGCTWEEFDPNIPVKIDVDPFGIDHIFWVIFFPSASVPIVITICLSMSSSPSKEQPHT